MYGNAAARTISSPGDAGTSTNRARHDARFTVALSDQCCWLAVNASNKAVAQLMRVTWRTVGSICERVAAEANADRDLSAGRKRIGIEADRQFRRVVDHADPAKLAVGVEHELTLHQPNTAPTEEVLTLVIAQPSNPDRHRSSTPSGTSSLECCTAAMGSAK